MNFPVTLRAKRPLSRADECYYCGQPVGGIHTAGCVLVVKTVRVRLTAEYDVTVPAHWDADKIEFHRNESSWCADNLVSEIETLQEQSPGCLCETVSFECISDQGEARLEE